MRGSFCLKLASAISGLFAAGHLAGFWRPAPENAAQQLAHRAMMINRFDLAGSDRSYWEIYLGFGLIIGVFYIVQTAILWLLPRLEDRKPILLSLTIGNAAILALLARYLFIIPQLMQAAIVMLLLLAAWRMRDPALKQ